MESTQPKLGSMRTGLFEIDLDAGELSKSGRKVGLQEQPFRVLKLLLQRQGEPGHPAGASDSTLARRYLRGF
jgi:DNA-binding response OmpR family regulator